MRFRSWKTGILLTSILLIILVTPVAFAGNYNRTYNTQVQFGLANHKLHVSVPSSLYDYYKGKTIKLANDNQTLPAKTNAATKHSPTRPSLSSTKFLTPSTTYITPSKQL
jgi:hypothetical protein